MKKKQMYVYVGNKFIWDEKLVTLTISINQKYSFPLKM